MQLGHSVVDDRTLERITIAPEIAIGKGIYQRPVIRFYVTENMWNDANKSTTNANSLVSKTRNANSGATTELDGRNDIFQMGFEAEVWF
jgi:maltoporin